MKKIGCAAILSVVLVATALLILAPNKTIEKTIVDANVTNRSALQVSQYISAQSPKANSQTQHPTSEEGLLQPQSSDCKKVLPLLSPFTAAVFIIGSVAVFGLILSLCLRKRCKSKTSISSHAIRMAIKYKKLDE